MSRQGILFVVSGPSGVGKSTLCKRIVQAVQRIRLSVSCTTRNPRPGEVEGRDYSFVDETTFRRMIEQNEFAEWAQVYDHLYGTPWRELTQAGKLGMDTVLDIDVQGARQVMKTLPGAVTVFVMPPSLEILKSRLSDRGTDSAEERERRFLKAQDEMKNFKDYQYTINNEKLENTVKIFQSIILAERVRTTRIDPEQVDKNSLLSIPKHRERNLQP